MEFTHVIITRFNVPTDIWTTTREGKKPLSEEWLKNRFEIFDNYTFPSFKNQKNKNFIWFVFFDTKTPDAYKTKIQDYQKQFTNFHPVFVQSFNELNETIKAKCLELLAINNTEYIITTDLDNDDMIHKEFINEVQKLFMPKHNLVIEIRKGLQLTKTSEKEAFINLFYMVANPFVSLVENKNIELETVIKEKHLNYRNYKDKVFYDKKPMFIQYIHENNLVNNTNNYMKRLFNIDYQSFGISSQNAFKISKTSAFYYNLKRYKSLIINNFFKN